MKFNHFLSLKDNMVVLFADIIGFSDVILNDENTSLITDGMNIYLENISESIICRYSREYQNKNKIKFIWVSDSIFLTCDKDNINTLLKELDYITHQMYCAHFSLRGGISLGKLYHKNNIWGPAVVNAVGLEKKAVNPCVVITKNDFYMLDINDEFKRFFINLSYSELMYYDFFSSFIDQKIRSCP
jgi:hypothetical protein